MFNAGFAQKVLEEVNKIRLNPKTYSNKIRGYLSCFQGNILRIPKQNALRTNEGAAAYREAADFLLSVPKLKPLASDKGLNNVAQEMADELTRCNEFEQMDSIDHEAIIGKYGKYEGKFGESTDFGSQTPEMVVINLLVDDGNKKRSNRKMLFEESYYKIGVGCAPHNKFKSVTVIMYATNFISGKGGSSSVSNSNVSNNNYSNNNYSVNKNSQTGYSTNVTGGETPVPPGIPYRYVKDVDPNKDLICDSASYNGPVTVQNVTGKFSEENFNPTQSANFGSSINPSQSTTFKGNNISTSQSANFGSNENYRKKVDLSNVKQTKVSGGGGILNTNVESSGWTPGLQNSDYVKARQRAEQEDLANNQFKTKLPDAKTQKVAGGGGILNTNVESSGWKPSLQRNYKAPQPEPKYDYMSRVQKDAKTQKVAGGGGILNTNVESSGWVTDFEKEKSPEYWKAKQEYQDNYKADIPLGTKSTAVAGGGGILNTNVESTNWNDYSGYERRIPYYNKEKEYNVYPKEQKETVKPAVNTGVKKETNRPVANTAAQKETVKPSVSFKDRFPDMFGVKKLEQSEKIINENGRKMVLLKTVRYMDDGEIKTEITKNPF